ncbi:hypothetical protein [Chryseobacterium sp. Mn2064]|uniref:hypothetical protein n=1 Tax=Chryseobacterium sp. Mn2064 TaxID=3395263 RepID=UPI003BD605BE
MNNYRHFIIYALSMFLFFLSIDSLKAQEHKMDRPSVHGMLLLGNSSLYGSHLPMFHSPHDYQVLLQLSINDKDKVAYIKDRIGHPDEKVYTLEPEVFVLPEILESRKSFKGNIYRGHFERGGVEILKNIEVHIDKILYFKKLNPLATKDKLPTYLLFGDQNEQFIAHSIKAQPDFDQLLSTQTKNTTVLDSLKKGKVVEIQLPDFDYKKTYLKKESGLLLNGEKLNITNSQQIYIEFDDLK